jgi:hypothetical protein
MRTSTKWSCLGGKNPNEMQRMSATRSLRAITRRARFDGIDRRAALRDLLTDLLHYCDRTGEDFHERLAAARDVYLEERFDKAV